MGAQERTGTAADRIGRGTAEALQRAFPATRGDAIAQAYPPDAACDVRFEALMARLEQISMNKEHKQ